VTATSVAPNSRPALPSASTSVCTPALRRAPGALASPAGSGRQSREARVAANRTVETVRTAPATTRAAAVDSSVPASRTSGGPETHVSSTAAESTA
jgi:hypothetical protein